MKKGRKRGVGQKKKKKEGRKEGRNERAIKRVKTPLE